MSPTDPLALVFLLSVVISNAIILASKNSDRLRRFFARLVGSQSIQ